MSIENDRDILPTANSLSQNYPNPFNSSTIISYILPQPADVTIDIYDILGRHISTLLDANQLAGNHQAVWNAEHATSGIYFYRLRAGDYVESKKMILAK